MGWASGTDLFDGAVGVALRYSPKVNTDEGAQTPPLIRRAIIEELYNVFVAADWDTEEESDYFLTDLVHIMYARGDIDEDYYQDVVGSE